MQVFALGLASDLLTCRLVIDDGLVSKWNQTKISDLVRRFGVASALRNPGKPMFDFPSLLF